METIAVINQKGGVCKSTNALNIGAALAIKGKKVLYIDLDPQGSLSLTLKADTKGSANAMAVLENEVVSSEDIQTIKAGGIIASSPLLVKADKLFDETGKEYRLKKALGTLQADYDYCIIDTPPALSILTVNALTASNCAIIPAQADLYSLQGITQLHATIKAVQEYCNPNLYIAGIVLNRYNSRTILTKGIEQEANKIADLIGTKVYKTKIRECIAVKEAQAMYEDVFTYAPKSNAAKDYTALCNEIVKGLHNG